MSWNMHWFWTRWGAGIASVLQLQSHLASGVLLGCSALASSVTDNIPLAAVLAQILGKMGTASDSFVLVVCDFWSEPGR